MKVLDVELELVESDLMTGLIPIDPAFWREGVEGGVITTYRSPKEGDDAVDGKLASDLESKPAGGRKPKSEKEPARRWWCRNLNVGSMAN